VGRTVHPGEGGVKCAGAGGREIYSEGCGTWHSPWNLSAGLLILVVWRWIRSAVGVQLSIDVCHDQDGQGNGDE
jgi:hypothetical protein